MVRRSIAVKIAVVAATITGLLTLGATSVYADEPVPPVAGSNAATPSPTSTPANNPWD